MNNKIVISILLSILVLPIVGANIIITLLPLDPGVSILFLVPIILIESILAYLIIKKMYKLKIGFLPILGMFLLFNIITTLIGWLFIFNDISSIDLIGGDLIFRSFFEIIGIFLLTVAVEFPAIYFLIKKKSKKPINISIITSLIVNFVSYSLLVLFYSF